MENIFTFKKNIESLLSGFDPDILQYQKDEFWLVQSVYEHIEFYAARRSLRNTAIALPLTRGLHDGTYRKSKLERNGIIYKQPYLIHPLRVTEMLVDLRLPLPAEYEDILLAASMCHDLIEDIPFANHGRELYETFQMDPRVYETVKKVSKRKDFTPEEENAFFHGIESDRLALLIKLSDRCNNVEDLYNMKVWKVHEYVGETRSRYLPMIEYGMRQYPELYLTLEILRDHIVSLTKAADILADRYQERELEIEKELSQLQEENHALRNTWQTLWNTESEDK
ncbi:MAG: hypothetical protein Q4B22_04420 [Eubacteriales bacterium]|nr:hypothetical protein [Eubacteriales bacterium]